MQAVTLYTKFTPQRTAAIREGLRIIRQIISSDASKEGLTTSEIYQLALREKPGKEYLDSLGANQANPNGLKGKGISSGGVAQSKSEDRKAEPPAPPNPRHPLKSMTFLKKEVLPILDGNQEIRLQKTTRLPVIHTPESTPTTTTAKNEKGTKKQKLAVKTSSSSTPSPVTVWLWKQFRETRPDSSIREYNGPWKKTKLSELGVTVNPLFDTGHLNRRRKFARYEKLARESAVISREERRVANGAEKELFTASELARITRNSRDGARRRKLF